MIAFLTSLSLASTMPEKPVRREPTALQCAASIALVPGRPIPADIVDENGNVRCGAIAVPTSHYADLLNTETYATDLRRWALIEIPVRDKLLEVSAGRAAYWEAQALRKTPVIERPWANQLIGAGLMFGAAYTWGLATH